MTLKEAAAGCRPGWHPSERRPRRLGVGLTAGFALRVIGAALLGSKVRAPRVPNDDFPPPARASARLGASASVRQKNSDSRTRQSSRRSATGDRLVMSYPFASRKRHL